MLLAPWGGFISARCRTRFFIRFNFIILLSSSLPLLTGLSDWGCKISLPVTLLSAGKLLRNESQISNDLFSFRSLMENLPDTDWRLFSVGKENNVWQVQTDLHHFLWPCPGFVEGASPLADLLRPQPGLRRSNSVQSSQICPPLLQWSSQDNSGQQYK